VRVHSNKTDCTPLKGAAVPNDGGKGGKVSRYVKPFTPYASYEEKDTDKKPKNAPGEPTLAAACTDVGGDEMKRKRKTSKRVSGDPKKKKAEGWREVDESTRARRARRGPWGLTKMRLVGKKVS